MTAKTIQEQTKEQIEVMEHFANGGEVERYYGEKDDWETIARPLWDWWNEEYRIKPVVDPYAYLKLIARDPTKQIRCNDAVGSGWQDAGYPWHWNCHPCNYEIRDKPKPMKQIKLLAWFTGVSLCWRTEGSIAIGLDWRRVPGEDKVIEVEG